ncbi:sensor histidine kinase [Pontiella sulfatireligans]|uniref:histidine kinase n=1 Tax=Pontiella sulfatireligans TaxID=2750658 RepID=A0A6C2UTB6_9BACT|nr:ATP-binding protein [Pontiella sulfatireligans]VGO23389.1 Sensor protein CzcS [Pontiella sulfatireligans]
MIRSFKLKIALFSVLLSGAMLLAFGLFFLQMSYKIGIDRTDRELRALVDADMSKSQPSNHWNRFNDSLTGFFGEAADKQFLLRISDKQNQPLFESAQWEEELVGAVLPSAPEAPPAERPSEKQRTGRQRKSDRPPPTVLPLGEARFITINSWRIMTVGNAEITAQLGISLDSLNAEIARFRNALLLAVPVALLLMIGGGWLLAQLALRPVNTIARTAKKVTALHLDERIPATKADHEFRQLIDIINEMLNRLEASFQQAVRFSADAAHELKTPLTILQGELENALQAAADGSADQRTYKESLDEVQRLKSIIRKLLLLAQADAGRLPLNFQPLEFSKMIENLVEDIGILNPDLETVADIQPGVTIEADAGLIGQIIQNLASNAVKFSQGEPPVTLSLKQKDAGVEFMISNRGQTIPAEDRCKIFDRFYRTDKARSRKTDGTGLGLSLAREIALAHRGTLELMESNEDITTFRLILPEAVND